MRNVGLDGFASEGSDAFGYFYFKDEANPDVFVKVLDWADRPYLLFWGGLTSYAYTVTFEHTKTKQSVKGESEAGSYKGGANTDELLH